MADAVSLDSSVGAIRRALDVVKRGEPALGEDPK